ncbi:3-oxoacyl-[acyl-carrier-protein] reductase [Rhodobacter aestuarii]|uniref:3-oxoacyl-[acyl-carrier-protein] reductase n=1 Tax=Rhodobacter aestuarii TaxID=453582 RepID=A0A1N7Q744_9RHOB|nr:MULTISPECIES: beta-ketoacyl-ACP reductase [Rhodobacter]PTV93853.1 3-oxoacyl-[acyl-carrier-protein] reductase [Rhodobacter aestuarii]SIT18397.1 3-oxoacyl-[acyl-carrier-protein] reductase [Rhodobacter aestuarii]SOC15558.1 3-oxoacyl-[acyl-carrier-protein] reductase [Rhodobacter sp. JA431]
MSRVALVTGGTRGIGAAISMALKEAGYTVVANYAGNDEAAREFSHVTGIKTYKWSVADYTACEDGIRQIEEEVGPIDVLVNNAGITRDAPFHKMSREQWDQVIGTNLSGIFNMTHPLWPGMRERKFGRIINISSINGQKGQFGQVNYSAAKAGDIGFTKALAQEGARSGITVNAICPGYIATEMVMAVPEKVRESIISTIPVGRLGEPDEIARTVVFLASDQAGFITGATMTVNGGQYLT